MTNAEKIKRMGNMDLTEFIADNFSPRKKCEFCNIGVDRSGKCNDSSRLCEEGIYEYLAKEVK